MMYKKRLFIVVVAFFAILVGCTSEEGEPVSSIEGYLTNGYSSADFSGIKVTLTDPSGSDPVQVCVTGSNGYFRFDNLKQTKYAIDIEREDWGRGMIIYSDSYENLERDGARTVLTNGRNEISIAHGTSLVVKIICVGRTTGGGLSVTTLDGRPVESINVQEGTTSVSIRICNEDIESRSWNVSLDFPYIYGCRDTTIWSPYGTVAGMGYTSAYYYDIGISQESGRLEPSESAVVVFTIPPGAYTLDHYSRYSSPIKININYGDQYVYLHFPSFTLDYML